MNIGGIITDEPTVLKNIMIKRKIWYSTTEDIEKEMT
jgi:hypothetical protein